MAEHRHKRETNARIKPRAGVLAGSVAVVATTSAVSLGVLFAGPAGNGLLAAETTAAIGSSIAASTDAVNRAAPVTRSQPRRATPTQADSAASPAPKKAKKAKAPSRAQRMLAAPAVAKAVKAADTKLWTTATLNLWTAPGDKAEKVGEIDSAEHVLVTGRSLFDRVEIVVDGQARWVTSGYLSEEEPLALGGDCTNGSSVPGGVSPNIKKVHRAVCAAFPELTSYGTFRNDGDHGRGIAIDIMVSGDRGWEVAEFVRDNYADLGVSYLIYAQKIWSVQRSGEGWRGMSNRGSATANHYDHVHVTTY